MTLSAQSSAVLIPAEAERASLSCILIKPEIIGWLGLDAEHYSVPPNRAVYEAMISLRDREVAVDVMTLEHELGRVGKLEAIGGLAYLGDLATVSATADNVEHYADVLRDSLTARRSMALSGSIPEWVRMGITGDELADRIASATGKLETRKTEGALTTRQMLMSEWKAIESDLESGKGARFVPTGFEGLDKFIIGLPRCMPSLIASRPAFGKTSIVINMAMRMCAAGYPVHWITTEDPLDMSARRVMARGTGVDSRVIASREFNRGHLDKLTGTMKGLCNTPGPIWENAKGRDARWICRRIQASAAKNKTAVVILDMIGPVSGPAGVKELRDRISANLTAINACTAGINAAFLMIHHLSREHEKEYKGGCPNLRGLSDCGNLERDSKLILMIEKKAQESRELDIWVPKNNNGPGGFSVSVELNKALCRVS